MFVSQSLTSRQLLTIQSVVAVIFFLAALVSEKLVSNSFSARHLVPFLTDTAPHVYAAFFFWLTFVSLGFVLFGQLYVGCGKKFQHKWLDCLLLQLLLSFILITRCLQFPIAYDDSYIDYRYVHNLVRHHTFDYNPGLHVMGFTSHLHLLVLSAMSIVFHSADIAFLSQQLNLVCQSVSCFLLYELLGRQINRLAAVLGGSLFALDAYLITECAYGKETSIVVLLTLLGLIAWEKKKRTLFAWSNSLLFLARPEGIAWLSAALFAEFWESRKISRLKNWALPLSIVFVWVVFLVLYFGTIVPHGALAKAKIYPHRPFIAGVLEIGAVISNFILPLNLHTNSHPLRQYAAIKILTSPSEYIFVFFAGLAVLATLGWFGLRYRWLRVYALGVSAITLFFAVSNPSMFTWYYCWFALIPMLIGPCLVSMLARKLKGGAKGLVPALLFVYLIMVPVCQAPYQVAKLPLPLFVWEDHQERLLSLLEATRWVKNTYGNDQVLAVLEPGIIGYYYDGPVIDLDGLVSDEMLKYYPLKSGTLPSGVVINIPTAAIHDLSPRWLIFFDRIGYNLTRDTDFCSRYTLRKSYPENFGVFKSTCVYERNMP